MSHTTTLQKVLLLVLLVLLSTSQVESVSAGINVWTSNGPEGGRIYTLAIDPVTPTTLYAGTWGGGVFKSANGGGNWTAVKTGLTNTYVQALVIDPATPATLYAGMEGGGVFAIQDLGYRMYLPLIQRGYSEPFVKHTRFANYPCITDA